MKLIEYKIEDLLVEQISGEWGSEPLEDTGVYVIRTANFLNTGKINYDNIVKRQIEPRKIEKKALQYGDIIIEKSGGSPTQPVGRVVYFDKKDDIYLTNNFTNILRPNLEKVDSKFLFYLLHYNHKLGKTLKYQNKTTGIINLKLPRYLISKVVIPQEIQYQKKIANLLSQIENLIIKREKSIELLNRLIKNTFLDMFGDPILDSKNWGRISLNSFGKIITGNTPPRGEKSFYDKDFIEWIKTDNLFEDRVYATKAKEYLSPQGLSVGRSVEKGSLLVTCIAGSLKSIGTAALVDRKVTFNQQINAIQPFEDVDSFFLYWMFKISKHYIQDRAGKGMKKIINKSAFQNILFPKPKYELQKKFGDIALKIENTKKIYENSLSELKQLFNSTSQKAFKGELELNIITLEFEDKLPTILDEIVKEEEEKTLHFEENHRKFTKITVTKIEDGEAHGFSMDAQGFKKLIKKTLAYEHTFEELDTKMRSKGWVIPYDRELNKKDKPFNYKDTIFELLKENRIFQKIREYEEDGELKRKILLKAKK